MYVCISLWYFHLPVCILNKQFGILLLVIAGNFIMWMYTNAFSLFTTAENYLIFIIYHMSIFVYETMSFNFHIIFSRSIP